MHVCDSFVLSTIYRYKEVLQGVSVQRWHRSQYTLCLANIFINVNKLLAVLLLPFLSPFFKTNVVAIFLFNRWSCKQAHYSCVWSFCLSFTWALSKANILSFSDCFSVLTRFIPILRFLLLKSTTSYKLLNMKTHMKTISKSYKNKDHGYGRYR